MVAAITPWNYPQALAAFEVRARAGRRLPRWCSSRRPKPRSTHWFSAEAATEAGLPPGVLNIVPGGTEAGAHLVAHPGVDKVSFTGSTAAGRAIGETCGRLLRPVTLELGGKSAAIILDDADLDATIAGPARAVVRQQRPDLLPELADPGAAVPLRRDRRRRGRAGRQPDRRRSAGPGHRHRAAGQRTAAGTGAGLHRRRHRRRRQTRCRRSIPADQPRGWFVEPTVFADVDNSDRHRPGGDLRPGAGRHSLRRRRRSGRRWPTTASTASAARSGPPTPSARPRSPGPCDTGTIGVNAYNLDVAAPFGGVKASGLGRELGPEGLDAYRVLKSIYRTGEA